MSDRSSWATPRLRTLSIRLDTALTVGSGSDGDASTLAQGN